jgi:hypothetical protein
MKSLELGDGRLGIDSHVQLTVNITCLVFSSFILTYKLQNLINGLDIPHQPFVSHCAPANLSVHLQKHVQRGKKEYVIDFAVQAGVHSMSSRTYGVYLVFGTRRNGSVVAGVYRSSPSLRSQGDGR